MRAIILGIKDYLKDLRQSRAVYNLYKFYRRPMYVDQDGDAIPIVEWLEGSVWHYIHQRRFTRKVLNRKELEKIQHWVKRVNTYSCPHCGGRCILPPLGGKDE